jgi:AraC-like DNA-binding protein
MKFLRPQGLLAGFYATGEEGPDCALVEAGEHWTSTDWRINDHINHGWELLFQIKGSSDWKLGRKKFSVPPGGFYLIAPSVRHELIRFHGSEIHFFFAVFNPAAVLAPSDRYLVMDWPHPFHAGPNAHLLESPFRALIREVGFEGKTKPIGIRIQLAALCLEIHRILSSPPIPAHGLSIHPAAIRARQFLDNRPDHPWKLDELAALCGISIPHLIDVFRSEFGETPKRYLLVNRLKRAEQLLRETNRPVTRIAFDLGFSSSQHFATAFRRYFGVPPRYRKRSSTKC